MFWLPKVPNDPLNFKKDNELESGSKKDSLETTQPTETEGKKPPLYPLET